MKDIILHHLLKEIIYNDDISFNEKKKKLLDFLLKIKNLVSSNEKYILLTHTLEKIDRDSCSEFLNNIFRTEFWTRSSDLDDLVNDIVKVINYKNDRDLFYSIIK